MDTMSQINNKYLIIVCCGDDSKHHSYAKVPQNDYFDVMCLYFGKGVRKADFQKYATYFYAIQGCKWTLITHALATMDKKKLFSQYRYVWIPDDDLEVDSEKVKMLFLHADHLGIHIGQPAIVPPRIHKNIVIKYFQKFTHSKQSDYRKYLKSTKHWNHIRDYISHVTLMPQHQKPHIRMVTNIEVMCPVVSTKFLQHLAKRLFLHPIFTNVMKSGWALEPIWRHEIQKFKPTKMVVFDYIVVVHTNTLSHRKASGTFYQQFNNNPFDEMKETLRRYNDLYGVHVTNVKYKTLNTINVLKNPQFNFSRLNVGLIHTPKTGGTALKSLLAQYTSDDHVEKVFLHVNHRPVWMIMNGHTPVRYLKPTFKLAFVIGVMRDPHERFISAFYYNKERGKNHPRQDLIVEVKEMHKLLKNVNSMESLLANNKLMQTVKRFNHFKPLSYWIMADDGKSSMVDYLIDQSSFSRDTEPLFKLLGIKAPLQRINTTSKKSSMTPREKELFEQHYGTDVNLYASLSKQKLSINKAGLEKLQRLLQP